MRSTRLSRRSEAWVTPSATRRLRSHRKAIGHLAFKDIDVLVLPTMATATPTVKDAAKNPFRDLPRLPCPVLVVPAPPLVWRRLRPAFR